MILYHASNVEVKMPMLVEANRLLDFGPGFYTTDNLEQAMRFAGSVVKKRGGKPILNVYEFDESTLCGLLVKKFTEPNVEWLDFVAANRSGTYVGERYDLLVGPVANDNVYTTIGLYFRGFMSKEATIAELRVHKLYNQTVFCTPKSFAGLKFIRSEAV